MHPEYILIIILNIILVVFFSIRFLIFSNNVFNYQESNFVKQSFYECKFLPLKDARQRFNTIFLFLLIIFFVDLGIVFLFPLCFSFNIYHAYYTHEELNVLQHNFETLSHTEISSRMAIDLKFFDVPARCMNSKYIDFNSNIQGNLFNHTAVPLPTEPESLLKEPEKAGFWTRISYNMQYYFLTSSNWLNSYISIFPRFDHNNSFVFKYFRNFETYPEELKLFNLKTENYQMELIRIQETNELNFKESLKVFKDKLIIPNIYDNMKLFDLEDAAPEKNPIITLFLELNPETSNITELQTYLMGALNQFSYAASCQNTEIFSKPRFQEYIPRILQKYFLDQSLSLTECFENFPQNMHEVAYKKYNLFYQMNLDLLQKRFSNEKPEIKSLVILARENLISKLIRLDGQPIIPRYSPLYYEYIHLIQSIYPRSN